MVLMNKRIQKGIAEQTIKTCLLYAFIKKTKHTRFFLKENHVCMCSGNMFHLPGYLFIVQIYDP